MSPIKPLLLLGEILSSHSDESEDDFLLGCCDMYCRLAEIVKRFRGDYCLPQPNYGGSKPMMQAVSTSQTSINLYQNTRRNIAEDSHLQSLLLCNKTPLVYKQRAREGRDVSRGLVTIIIYFGARVQF
jgi:hypothetical protein